MKRSPMPPRRVPLSAAREPWRRKVPAATSRGQLERTAAVKRTIERKRVKQRRPDVVPEATRALVWARAGGCCEICGRPLLCGPWSIHHRQARQAGGRRTEGTHCPSNLLLLDGTGTLGCHGQVESRREVAYASGWLVHSWDAPVELPALIHGRGWTYLDSGGRYGEGSL